MLAGKSAPPDRGRLAFACFIKRVSSAWSPAFSILRGEPAVNGLVTIAYIDLKHACPHLCQFFLANLFILGHLRDSMTRTLEHPADPQFIHRMSPRAMNGEALTRDDLLPLFEAARWAPSCNNSQPWRFVYALAGTPAFEALFATLAAGNQPWVQRAGALVLACANTLMPNGKPTPTPAFDAGAAWMSFALQGSLSGLVVHAMAGFDAARAREAAHVPEDHLVIAMIAVGKPGSIDDLPEPYRAREVPSPRNSVESFVREGSF